MTSLMCTLGSGVPWVPSLALLLKYLENLLVFSILALQATAFFIISLTFRSWYPSTEVLRVTSPTISEELVSGVLLLAPYVLYWLVVVNEILVAACYCEELSVLLLHALPENLGHNSYLCHGLKIMVFYFFISKTLEMIRISFMASLLNAVL